MQYRLQKACNNTVGKFLTDEKNELVACDFGTHKIEIEKDNMVTLSTHDSPSCWARFWATDIGNMFEEDIPITGQGIYIKSDKVRAAIGLTGWDVVELG